MNLWRKLVGYLGVFGLLVVVAIAAFLVGQLVVHREAAREAEAPRRLEDSKRVAGWKVRTIPPCEPGGGLEALVPTEKQAAKVERDFGVKVSRGTGRNLAGNRPGRAVGEPNGAGQGVGSPGTIGPETGSKGLSWWGGLVAGLGFAGGSSGGEAEKGSATAPGAPVGADRLAGEGSDGARVVSPETGQELIVLLVKRLGKLSRGGELLVGAPVAGGKVEAIVKPAKLGFWKKRNALEVGLGLGKIGRDELRRAWGAYEPFEMGEGWIPRFELFGEQRLAPVVPGVEKASNTDLGGMISLVWRPTLGPR